MQNDVRALLPDSSRRTADIAADLAAQSKELFMQFFDLSLMQEKEYSMRSSRVVFLVGEMKPEWIDELEAQIIDILPTLHNESVIRVFIRIFRDRKLPGEELLGKLVSYCFDILENRSYAVAIEANAMTILWRVAKKIPELSDELILLLQDRLEDDSSAISHHAKLIVKDLKYR